METSVSSFRQIKLRRFLYFQHLPPCLRLSLHTYCLGNCHHCEFIGCYVKDSIVGNNLKGRAFSVKVSRCVQWSEIFPIRYVWEGSLWKWKEVNQKLQIRFCIYSIRTFYWSSRPRLFCLFYSSLKCTSASN